MAVLRYSLQEFGNIYRASPSLYASVYFLFGSGLGIPPFAYIWPCLAIEICIPVAKSRGDTQTAVAAPPGWTSPASTHILDSLLFHFM